MSQPQVTALFVHPVKSARGRALEHITLDARGVVGDRRYMVVDENWRFLTQRDTPRLGCICPAVTNGHLALSRAGAAPLTIAADPGDAREVEAVIWRDAVRVRDLGDVAAAWLHDALGRPARLVGISANYSRPVRGERAQPGDEVALTDAHPLLVIGVASLADLNARLDFPVPMDRFRPNLVVDGAAAFAEDSWHRIRIGDVVLRASGPCARCAIPNTDQVTLERGHEPLRTLATYRRKTDGAVYFGQNYINETKTGTISVGARVEILA